MPTVRPPIRSVPLLARCPVCGHVVRATVDFRDPDPAAFLVCPWCRQQVTITLADDPVGVNDPNDTES
jgi:transcription elongation factor Elf1